MPIFRFLVSVLLLFTVPSLPLYSAYTIPKTVLANQDPNTPLSYDDFLQLFAKIESGEIAASCTAKEKRELTEFIACLAKIGELPDSSGDVL
jgi:hypothetical protein